MTTNAYSGFKFGRFWDKIPDFNGRKQKVWYPPNGKPPMHLVCIVFWPAMRPNGPKMPIFGQKFQFWAKFGCLWAKISFNIILLILAVRIIAIFILIDLLAFIF
jgi:hypothetical protein